MGRIFVDGSSKNEITDSFAYENKHAEVEEVLIITDEIVEIRVDNGRLCIYVRDICKLVKALKAAYKHIEGKDVDE